ncbi:MAG: DUF4065 domain-containing protein [Silvanigrellaceae bacterium]|nr:DUF4065 domain-containing protein [Silvanigrellaceae bacterium]
MTNSPKIYQASSVANKMLEIASERGNVLTPMQLIKLVYLAHAWMLALHRRPLAKEAVEAWKYGPVIPQLYHEIKNFRSNPVTKINCAEESFDEESQDIIQQAYSQYGNWNGMEWNRINYAYT